MAWVAAVEQVQSLAQELPHAEGETKKKKKKERKEKERKASQKKWPMN